MLVAFDGVSSLESSSSINYYVVSRDGCQDIVYVKPQGCIESVYTGDCKHLNNRSSRNFLFCRMTATQEARRRPFLRGSVACAYIAAFGCEGLATASTVQHGSRVVPLQDQSISAFVGSLTNLYPVGWRQRRGHSKRGSGCSPSMVASVKVSRRGLLEWWFFLVLSDVCCCVSGWS